MQLCATRIFDGLFHGDDDITKVLWYMVADTDGVFSRNYPSVCAPFTNKHRRTLVRFASRQLLESHDHALLPLQFRLCRYDGRCRTIIIFALVCFHTISVVCRHKKRLCYCRLRTSATEACSLPGAPYMSLLTFLTDEWKCSCYSQYKAKSWFL